ncbi:hypothetical protein MSAN_00662100 [Mycena sanguinolenta]|uniref:Uncharacterized protein n=1 Tax=Mycena sanguinolenta TaxID=230812 RepID=A0A8H6Z0A6_9AGAR|nr:hypothetical protein MSAN_00662100 [Mycena sanguinolenta]
MHCDQNFVAVKLPSFCPVTWLCCNLPRRHVMRCTAFILRLPNAATESWTQGNLNLPGIMARLGRVVLLRESLGRLDAPNTSERYGGERQRGKNSPDVEQSVNQAGDRRDWQRTKIPLDFDSRTINASRHAVMVFVSRTSKERSKVWVS